MNERKKKTTLNALPNIDGNCRKKKPIQLLDIIVDERRENRLNVDYKCQSSFLLDKVIS